VALPVAVVAGLVAARLTANQPIEVPDPPSSVESRRLCAALTAALPRRLAQLAARTVDGNPRAAAAWGDPPVILRCGLLATPSQLGQLVTLDGVNWAPVVGKHEVTWTAVGRPVTVQVRVPRRYDSQALLLAELSPVIVRTLPASP